VVLVQSWSSSLPHIQLRGYPRHTRGITILLPSFSRLTNIITTV
jgi:hypothetical protein